MQEKGKELEFVVALDATQLNEAIKKTQQLIDLLKEVHELLGIKD